jgi:hypothetical protein
MPAGPNPITIDFTDAGKVLIPRPGVIASLTYMKPPISSTLPPHLFHLTDDSGLRPVTLYCVDLSCAPWMIPAKNATMPYFASELLIDSGYAIRFQRLTVASCPRGVEMQIVIG